LCAECRQILVEEATRGCKKCGNPPSSCRCAKIRFIANLDQIIFPYFYDGELIRRAIYAVKRANLYYINEFFAKGMYNSLEINDRMDKIKISGIDYVTCAPRKKDSVRLYGYNHTEQLAKLISKYTGITYMPIIAASKAHDTDQKNLNRRERAVNVKDKFVPAKKLGKTKDILQGKSVLVIDDIVTTGSTLAECSRVVRELGAKTVTALCAASVN